MTAPKQFTFWVVPAEPLRTQLASIIRDLAREFDAPLFDPHCTVFGDCPDKDESLHLARHIAQNFTPLELEVEGLAQSSHLTKTFYVQFKQSAELRRIFDYLRDTTAAKTGYELNPHLSLLYQHLSETQRQELCRRQSLVPMGAYRFDALSVAEIDNPVENTQALGNMRSILDLKLTGI